MRSVSGGNGKQELLDSLTTLACAQGASNAAIIPTTDILVEDRLADLCSDPGSGIVLVSAI